jgi:translation initiation factor IF-3
MTMVLAPHRGAKTRAKAAHDADAPARQRASAQPAEAPTDTPQN